MKSVKKMNEQKNLTFIRKYGKFDIFGIWFSTEVFQVLETSLSMSKQNILHMHSNNFEFEIPKKSLNKFFPDRDLLINYWIHIKWRSVENDTAIWGAEKLKMQKLISSKRNHAKSKPEQKTSQINSEFFPGKCVWIKSGWQSITQLKI